MNPRDTQLLVVPPQSTRRAAGFTLVAALAANSSIPEMTQREGRAVCRMDPIWYAHPDCLWARGAGRGA